MGQIIGEGCSKRTNFDIQLKKLLPSEADICKEESKNKLVEIIEKVLSTWIKQF